jgi:hypothetical protein
MAAFPLGMISPMIHSSAPAENFWYASTLEASSNRLTQADIMLLLPLPMKRHASRLYRVGVLVWLQSAKNPTRSTISGAFEFDEKVISKLKIWTDIAKSLNSVSECSGGLDLQPSFNPGT